MRITYVGFGDFHRHAGMKQLYHFAQQVSRRNHQTQILVAGRADSANTMDEHALSDIVEMEFVGPLLTSSVRKRIVDFRPDILHVWTPRFVPALVGWQIHRLTGAQVIVDHEDDEIYHLRYIHYSWTKNWQMGWRRLAIPAIVARNTVQPWLRPLRKNSEVTRGAQEILTYKLLTNVALAHTAISPNLVDWARRQWPGKPTHLLYPGARLDLFKPGPPDADLQERFGLRGSRVLVYTGTMSLAIFGWFLDMLEQLSFDFPDIKLLLIGEHGFHEQALQLGNERHLGRNYILIEQQPYADVPRYLSLADILLQHPLDLGNEMRLPAKLPEYLAMGKPVITFAAGIGRTFMDGVHVRKVYGTDPLEAAIVVKELFSDSVQCQRLGIAARAVASERFDWSSNGRELVGIYDEVSERTREIV